MSEWTALLVNAVRRVIIVAALAAIMVVWLGVPASRGAETCSWGALIFVTLAAGPAKARRSRR